MLGVLPQQRSGFQGLNPGLRVCSTSTPSTDVPTALHVVLDTVIPLWLSALTLDATVAMVPITAVVGEMVLMVVVGEMVTMV